MFVPSFPQINPDVLYYTLQGEPCWDTLKLLFAQPPFSFWGERRVPVAPPLDYFAVPQDPDSLNNPYSSDVESGTNMENRSGDDDEVDVGDGSDAGGDADVGDAPDA